MRARLFARKRRVATLEAMVVLRLEIFFMDGLNMHHDIAKCVATCWPSPRVWMYLRLVTFAIQHSPRD